MHPPPRNILQMIETSGPGGAERVMISLCESLRDRGHRVTALLLKRGWLSDQLEKAGIPFRILRLSRPLDPAFLLALRRTILEIGPDIIHAHEFTMNWYGALAGKLAGRPVIATVHGKAYYPDAGRRRLMVRSIEWVGGQVVAVSEDIKTLLEDRLGLRRVRRINNGIDIGRFSQAYRSEARKSLGLAEDDLVVGAIGNLYPVKGHSVLVEAAALCDHPRPHVVIAGRGGEEGPLRQLAESKGMGSRLHLLGFRDDVPQLLSAFDLYALPSFSEGQSLALMEAMAAGKPIIASRVGGNPELIRHGVNGLLFEAGDASGLAACMRDMRSNPARAQGMAEAAKERAQGDFSLQAMVGQYERLYIELVR